MGIVVSVDTHTADTVFTVHKERVMHLVMVMESENVERTWPMLFMILEDSVLITLCPAAEVSEFIFVIPH